MQKHEKELEKDLKKDSMGECVDAFQFYLSNFLTMAGMEMKVLGNLIKEQLKAPDIEELNHILKSIFTGTFHWVLSLHT